MKHFIDSCFQSRLRWWLLAALIGVLLTTTAWNRITAECAEAEPQAAAQSISPASRFLPLKVLDRGWPFVRGPDFDGHSPEINLAESWPAGGPPVLWTRELGQGYSGFVAAGSRVYTQYQDLGGQYVICLDALTGKTIWKYRYGWPYEIAGLYPGPRATPTLAEGRIYFATPSGAVGCLSAAGRSVWSVNLKKRFDGRGTDFGYACSPTVVGGTLFAPVGGKGAAMVALDARDGSVVWQSGDDSASYTPALPITVGGKRQLIGYMEHAVVGFDQATGRILWRVELSHGYDEHAAWPVYQEPYLWFSGPFRAGSQLLKLPTQPGETCQSLWHSKIMSNDVASSVLVSGCIYGFDLYDVQTKVHRLSRGSFRCIELLTGNERWSNGKAKQRRDPADNQVIGHASVIVADGKLIVLNDSGELILARAAPRRYEELARVSLLGGEICWTAPALHRGCVYVRNHSRAACVYIGKPELLDRDLRDSALTALDIPQSEYLDLASILGVEPEYAFDVPTARSLRTWYLLSMALLGASMVVASCAWAVLRNWTKARWILLAVAFLLGVLGTTLLSIARGEFVFTWPLALFISFQTVIDQVRIGPQQSTDRPRRWWRTRIAPSAFIIICVLFFLICRRLSLATEWVFLTGFVAALPVALIGKWLHDRSKLHPLVECLLMMVSFSAYFWASIALLALKYEIVMM